MEAGMAEVVKLKNGWLELRDGDRRWRLSRDDSITLFTAGLLLLGYVQEERQGVAIDAREPVEMPPGRIQEWLERLRASGTPFKASMKRRTVLMEAWRTPVEQEPEYPAPRVRRFTRESAAPPASTRPAVKKTVKVVLKEADELPVLFEDPGDQVAYEVRHAWLLSVPVSQREQWPLGDYLMLPQFLEDLKDQGGGLSRAQMIGAIVDVVSGRVADVPSRQARYFKEADGEVSRGRPKLVRADGAVAWRANVSHSTPAARRIMWWRNPDGTIELARLARHDDMEMPEH
jgi:hypothetical protein